MHKLLKEIAIITMGQSPKSSCYNTNSVGLPFLQGKTTFGRIYPSYDTWSSEWNKTALPNDILFTVRAPVGDVNMCKTETAIGRGIASIRAINCNNKYLFYLLQANNNLFTSNSTGTIFESINKDTLENTKFYIHSKEKQNHIVNTIYYFSVTSRISFICISYTIISCFSSSFIDTTTTNLIISSSSSYSHISFVNPSILNDAP